MRRTSQHVEINTITHTNKDSRGQVWEWKFKDGRQVTLFTRKQGVHFAHHYHTGSDPSKNPERFFLVSGRVKVTWWESNNKKHTRNVRPGSEIIIPARVPHCFDALEDCTFLEYRTTHFDPKHSDVLPLTKHPS